MTDAKTQTGAVMALIVLATVVDGMDASIVNVVLPDISRELGMSVSSSAFVSVAYLIPIAGLCLAFSKLAERADIRRMFLVGTAVFSLASLGCSTSSSEWMLVLMRFVQGIGATFMVATTPIMVVRLLPEDHRGRGMGAIAAGSGISVIIGPTVGGLIGDMLSWHWVFLINIPLGIALAAAAMALLPRSEPGTRARLPDVPAMLLMFLGMGLVMVSLYGFIDGYLPGPAVVAALAVGCALVIASVLRSGRSDDPLVHLDLLRDRRFATVTLIFMASTMMGAGVMYLLPYYLSMAEGMSPFQTGLLLAGASVITVAMTFPTGRWCDRRGCRIPASLALALRVAFSAMLAVVDPALGMGYILLALAIMGMSFGISGTSQSTRMLEESPDEYSGEAGSMAMMINYVGYAFGLVAFAIVFMLLNPGGGMDFDLMGEDQFMAGFHGACLFGSVLAAVALAASLAVRGRGSRSD